MLSLRPVWPSTVYDGLDSPQSSRLPRPDPTSISASPANGVWLPRGIVRVRPRSVSACPRSSGPRGPRSAYPRRFASVRGSSRSACPRYSASVRGPRIRMSASFRVIPRPISESTLSAAPGVRQLSQKARPVRERPHAKHVGDRLPQVGERLARAEIHARFMASPDDEAAARIRARDRCWAWSDRCHGRR